MTGIAGRSHLEAALSSRQAQPDVLLAAFDQLDTVDCDFMLGRWQGFEIATGHPMNGWLEVGGWYGKWFIDPDNVHPLLFFNRQRDGLISVDPRYLPMNAAMRWPQLQRFGHLLTPSLGLVRSREGRARLRLTEFRGKTSATMIYDHQPIHDIFRRIDQDRVLGLMDLKSTAAPYFFVLERDQQASLPVAV